jgi:hypothetical protein
MPETALDRCLSCLDFSVIAYKASVGVMAEGELYNHGRRNRRNSYLPICAPTVYNVVLALKWESNFIPIVTHLGL